MMYLISSSFQIHFLGYCSVNEHVQFELNENKAVLLVAKTFVL